jgi:hypothetical protein
VTPISFEIPPGSAFATAYGPWLLKIHIPIAAVTFFMRRQALGRPEIGINTSGVSLAGRVAVDDQDVVPAESVRLMGGL